MPIARAIDAVSKLYMLALIFAGAFAIVRSVNSLASHELQPHSHSIPSA